MIDKCPICGEYIKGAEGAKVYHMNCLMKKLADVRKEVQELKNE